MFLFLSNNYSYLFFKNPLYKPQTMWYYHLVNKNSSQQELKKIKCMQ